MLKIFKARKSNFKNIIFCIVLAILLALAFILIINTSENSQKEIDESKKLENLRFSQSLQITRFSCDEILVACYLEYRYDSDFNPETKTSKNFCPNEGYVAYLIKENQGYIRQLDQNFCIDFKNNNYLAESRKVIVDEVSGKKMFQQFAIFNYIGVEISTIKEVEINGLRFLLPDQQKLKLNSRQFRLKEFWCLKTTGDCHLSYTFTNETNKDIPYFNYCLFGIYLSQQTAHSAVHLRDQNCLSDNYFFKDSLRFIKPGESKDVSLNFNLGSGGVDEDIEDFQYTLRFPAISTIWLDRQPVFLNASKNR